MRVVLCKTATDALAHGMNAQQAADHAIKVMQDRVQGYGGLILVDRQGQVAFAYNTPHMAVAWVNAQGEVVARIKED
jgi:beta-aspartyl-peptidase (threonine type)